MDYAESQRSFGKHAPSIIMVALLHIAIGYALVTGLARKVVEVIKAPLETKIIEEIKKPPPDQPPPPPPKLAAPPPPFIPPPEINIQVPVTQSAPAITVTTPTPPPVAVVVAPPAPPAVQPAIRKDFKPTQRVQPTYPRQLIQAGVTGKVTAHMYVAANGTVTDVKILASSNRLFDREIIRALMQYRFTPEATGFIVETDIEFKLQD